MFISKKRQMYLLAIGGVGLVLTTIYTAILMTLAVKNFRTGRDIFKAVTGRSRGD